MESLPGDLSRDITELRCIDMERTRSALKELENCCEELKPNVSENDKKDLSSRIRRALLEIRKIGDTKMNVVSSMQETVTTRIHYLVVVAYSCHCCRLKNIVED